MFGEMDKKVVVIVLVLLVVGDGLCGGKFRIFLTSPCPDIFQYKYDDYDGRLYGVLRVDCRVPECRALYDKVVQLQVQLSVGNMIYENYHGKIELAHPKNKVIEDVLLQRPIDYTLNFPYWTNIPPKITKILVNGNLICSGPQIPMNLVRVLSTINLQHTLRINLPSDESMLSPVDTNSPEVDDQEVSPSTTYNQYIFRPSSSTNNKFNNFNKPSSDFSNAYPGNPFLNNLATSSPNAAPPENVAEVEVRRYGGSVNWNGGGGPVVENFRPQELAAPTQNPRSKGSLSTSLPNREYRGIQLDAGSALAGNPFFKSSTFPVAKEQETTTLPPVQNRGIVETAIESADGPIDTKTVLARNPFLKQTVTTAGTTTQKEEVTLAPVVQNKNVNTDKEVVTTSTPRIESKNDDVPFGEICGRSTVANSLVVHGEPVSRGAYPWLVAMFWLKNLGPEFRCSGSLVSDRHVVTAAHCLKNNTRTLRPEELLLILGKLNIKNWYREIGLQVGVESIDIHPSYQPLSADADIAVITLSEKITFTKFIRPICLWSGSNQLKEIVGEQGTVVGWGKDENGDFMTEVPKKVTMPVVSQEDCIRSKYSFRDITSERTFCAGFRNGTGPCNGDSGSGFILKKDDRWILRGIVSTSLLDQEQKSCDLKHYVVFTDASKFLDWLSSKIR